MLKFISSTRRMYLLQAVAAAGLLGLLVYLAWSTMSGLRGEQRLVAQVLTAQGETLIRAMEAGGRLGMRGPAARTFRLRLLLEEMARQDDVQFLAIIRPDGSLEAHSLGQNAAELPSTVFAAFLPTDEPSWTIFTDTPAPIFVVFRAYRPLQHTRHGANPFAQMFRAPMRPPVPPPLTPEHDSGRGLAVVAVGLDASPYIQARRTDIVTLILASVLLVIMAGMAAALWFWRRNALHFQQRVAQTEHLAAVGSLAAGVAHEIRNPLSSIKGFATVFRDTFPPDSSQYAQAELMIGEVERLNRTISELLEFSRPETLHRIDIDATELLRHALKLVAGDCHATGIEMQCLPSASEIRISADRDRLLQVLLNILLNAIQAMPEGGHLRAMVRRSGGWVRFHVVDTGSGIAREALPHIFDPYFTTRHQGTGLGLPLARKIMDAHGGRICIAATSALGTEVVAEIPQGDPA